MIGRIFTVGGFTLLSRLTGFIRDMVLAAVLGAGPVADAFFVAFRLPNHFRAIFAEGAFNAAFIPAYARVRTQESPQNAALFLDRIFTMLLGVQIVLLAIALLFMPQVVALLAPGFGKDAAQFALAVDLTRITFPYLLLVTVVTLFGGILNVVQKFASAAAAPILLNLSMIAALLLATQFPTAGHAAAWGVFIAGCLEVLLLVADTGRSVTLPRLSWPKWDDDLRRFFIALGPATLGSMGTQLALFADTIIASLLASGALSALYYADRLNQLPIGVIGIAVGTVLLPDMARRIAAGDEAGAARAQRQAIELTLLLSLPFLVAFLVIPDLLMRGLFMRGAFTAQNADAAGATLAAYAVGLIPFVLIRSATAPFLARGDTATPVKAALAGVAVNVALKVALMGSLAQIGLALATAAGAWVNLLLVLGMASRAGIAPPWRELWPSLARFALVAVLLAVVLAGASRMPLAQWTDPAMRDLAMTAILAVAAGLLYSIAIYFLFGRRWLFALAGRRGSSSKSGETQS